MIENYFQHIERLGVHSSFVHSSSITYDKRSRFIGSIRGQIQFIDGSALHFREFVNIEKNIERYMYVYHYQTANDTLVFRYDNAPHYPDLPNFPHHKHG